MAVSCFIISKKLAILNDNKYASYRHINYKKKNTRHIISGNMFGCYFQIRREIFLAHFSNFNFSPSLHLLKFQRKVFQLSWSKLIEKGSLFRNCETVTKKTHFKFAAHLRRTEQNKQSKDSIHLQVNKKKRSKHIETGKWPHSHTGRSIGTIPNRPETHFHKTRYKKCI